MTRSGYSDNCDQWAIIRWRGAVESAIRGRRGQSFLKEMLAALDALPTKRLIEGDLVADGDVCALGSVGVRRGLDMTALDPDDRQQVASALAIPPALAAEIMYENDEAAGYWVTESPEARWRRIRRWVISKICVG
jgi:hypothetical protein